MYAMISFSFLGSDDHNYESHKIGQTTSLDATIERIKSEVIEFFGDRRYVEIYYSDNNQSTLDISEVLRAITVKEMTEAEYNAIKKFFGDYVGHYPEEFMQFA